LPVLAFLARKDDRIDAGNVGKSPSAGLPNLTKHHYPFAFHREHSFFGKKLFDFFKFHPTAKTGLFFLPAGACRKIFFFHGMLGWITAYHVVII
jgi:hypothetical protein